MPPNLLKYSNGWGHLLMSLSSQVVAVILLLQHDATLTGLAAGLLVAVSGYWFISSSANAQQVAAAQQAAATAAASVAPVPQQAAAPVAPVALVAPAAPVAAKPIIQGGSNGNSTNG